jgi:hypothetical protein
MADKSAVEEEQTTEIAQATLDRVWLELRNTQRWNRKGRYWETPMIGNEVAEVSALLGAAFRNGALQLDEVREKAVSSRVGSGMKLKTVFML